MKKEQKKSWLVAVWMFVAVIIILCAFLWVRSHSNKEVVVTEKTEAEKLLEYDLEGNYPGSARDVIRVYNRLLSCFYNEELTDEEIGGLARQARILFDAELLKRNPLEAYVENLKEEILLYKELGRTIINVELQKYEDIRFEAKGEENTASLLSYYFMKEGTGNRSNYMRYYLREDEEGKWRILFWEVSDETF